MELIPTGSKFAVLTVETNRIDKDVPETVQLTESLFVLRRLPIELPSYWKELLGSHTAGRLNETGLHAVSFSPASNPAVLDHENKTLGDIVHRLYWSLLLSVPFFAHEQGLLLTGTRYEDRYEVRSSQQYPRLPWTPWAPRDHVDQAAIRRAYALSQAINDLLTVSNFERLARGNRAFYAALQHTGLGERILGFVRTAEAFILPPVGQAREAFIQRGSLFVGNGETDALGQMYDIRSASVHLHDPTRLLPRATERIRRLLLLKRCIQAEALARHCLARLPQRKNAHRFFQDDQTLESFWSQKSASQRSLWGAPIDLQAALAEVRDDWVDDETLGLGPSA